MLEELTGKLTECEAKVGDLGCQLTRNKITDAIRGAATEAKVVSSAIDDIVAIGVGLFDVREDGQIFTRANGATSPGLDPKQWITTMQDSRAHWWPQSEGAGARGGRGGQSGFADNPWNRQNWNITEQGKVMKADPAKAKLMAELVRTYVALLKSGRVFCKSGATRLFACAIRTSSWRCAKLSRRRMDGSLGAASSQDGLRLSARSLLASCLALWARPLPV